MNANKFWRRSEGCWIKSLTDFPNHNTNSFLTNYQMKLLKDSQQSRNALDELIKRVFDRLQYEKDRPNIKDIITDAWDSAMSLQNVQEVRARSMLDQFAIAALPTCIHALTYQADKGNCIAPHEIPAQASSDAYMIADEMLKVRDGGQTAFREQVRELLEAIGKCDDALLAEFTESGPLCDVICLARAFRL